VECGVPTGPWKARGNGSERPAEPGVLESTRTASQLVTAQDVWHLRSCIKNTVYWVQPSKVYSGSSINFVIIICSNDDRADIQYIGSASHPFPVCTSHPQSASCTAPTVSPSLCTSSPQESRITTVWNSRARDNGRADRDYLHLAESSRPSHHHWLLLSREAMRRYTDVPPVQRMAGGRAAGSPAPSLATFPLHGGSPHALRPHSPPLYHSPLPSPCPCPCPCPCPAALVSLLGVTSRPSPPHQGTLAPAEAWALLPPPPSPSSSFLTICTAPGSPSAPAPPLAHPQSPPQNSLSPPCSASSPPPSLPCWPSSPLQYPLLPFPSSLPASCFHWARLPTGPAVHPAVCPGTLSPSPAPAIAPTAGSVTESPEVTLYSVPTPSTVEFEWPPSPAGAQPTLARPPGPLPGPPPPHCHCYCRKSTVCPSFTLGGLQVDPALCLSVCSRCTPVTDDGPGPVLKWPLPGWKCPPASCPGGRFRTASLRLLCTEVSRHRGCHEAGTVHAAGTAAVTVAPAQTAAARGARPLHTLAHGSPLPLAPFQAQGCWGGAPWWPRSSCPPERNPAAAPPMLALPPRRGRPLGYPWNQGAPLLAHSHFMSLGPRRWPSV